MRWLVLAGVVVGGIVAACSSDDGAGGSSASDAGVEASADGAGGRDVSSDLPDVCVPKTKAYCPSDWECGTFPDGCGGTVYCGSSTESGCSSEGYSQCGAVTANRCLSCAPTQGACPTGQSAFACPSASELPSGCRAEQVDAGEDAGEVDAGTYACCPTR